MKKFKLNLIRGKEEEIEVMLNPERINKALEQINSFYNIIYKERLDKLEKIALDNGVKKERCDFEYNNIKYSARYKYHTIDFKADIPIKFLEYECPPCFDFNVGYIISRLEIIRENYDSVIPQEGINEKYLLIEEIEELESCNCESNSYKLDINKEEKIEIMLNPERINKALEELQEFRDKYYPNNIKKKLDFIAVFNGLTEHSYNTVSNGTVTRYRGKSQKFLYNGNIYKGYGYSYGTASWAGPTGIIYKVYEPVFILNYKLRPLKETEINSIVSQLQELKYKSEPPRTLSFKEAFKNFRIAVILSKHRPDDILENYKRKEMENWRSLKLNLVRLKEEDFADINKYFPNLKKLYIDTMDGNIPYSIVNLKKLNSLTISCSVTCNLEPITKILNLKHLSISFCLDSLPESIGELTNLVELDVWHNRLQALPDSLDKLTNLKSLGLSDNKLESLPECIFNMKNLEYLNLDNNKLKQIPESISRLTKLESLNICNNQLESLPESLGSVYSLKWLTLRNNKKLESLPASLDNLYNLNNLIK